MTDPTIATSTWSTNWDLDNFLQANSLKMAPGGTPVSMVWADVETTGLDEGMQDDHTLEVGLAATDHDGNLIDIWSSLVWDEDWAKGQITGEALDMHIASGLLSEHDIFLEGLVPGYHPSQMEPATVEGDALEWLRSLGVEEATQAMCGSSISFDRHFLEKDLPSLEAFFHYRQIDVSSVKELARRLNPRIFDHRPEGYKKHRVIWCLADSINEYKFYKENFLFVDN